MATLTREQQIANTIMEQEAVNAVKDRFRRLLFDYGLTKQDAADLLHVSVWTIEAWLKPYAHKSSNPVPPWAPELITYKMNDPNLHIERTT